MLYKIAVFTVLALPVLCAYGAVAVAPDRVEPARYAVTDLGTDVALTDINNRGQIVGNRLGRAKNAAGRAFLWADGRMTDLKPLPGDAATRARALNDSGQVVGWSGSDGGPFRAVLWKDGKPTVIEPPAGFSDLDPCRINDRGQITGTVALYGEGHKPLSPWPVVAMKASRAFLYSNGKITLLASLGGSYSGAAGINDRGEVVGDSTSMQNGEHPVLWSAGRVWDLGTFGGSAGEALDINNSGQVIGWAMTASDTPHGFLYDRGVLQDLGTLPNTDTCIVRGINRRGEIVGYVTETLGDVGMARSFAILWKNGTMYDLNDLLPADSGWDLDSTTRINDCGQIIASGTFRGEAHHVCLLTPLTKENR